ncbi:hypothetical protein SDC9_202143 [bioreactor metagenome]|uniref:Uncharacterized protein n=1 Tax=bioreactor metagenome TaxID=1076179 RepID=A0A645J4R8_9ZZZZ
MILAFDRAGPGDDHQPFPAYLVPGHRKLRIAGMEHAVGLFEGLQHPHDPVHIGVGLQAADVDLAGVPHQAKDGQVRAVHGADGDALLFNIFGKKLDLLLRSTLFKHNDHVQTSPNLPSESDIQKREPEKSSLLPA